jgi:archaellum component FlaC
MLRVNQVVDTAHQEQVIELLNTLDQQLGICSVNMAQISKAANEQLEIVRNLAETIQHQAFNEIGLSLNSLSESMSAALEPMQAVGELVPAIDNLIVTLESRQAAGEIGPALEKLIATSREMRPMK